MSPKQQAAEFLRQQSEELEKAYKAAFVFGIPTDDKLFKPDLKHPLYRAFQLTRYLGCTYVAKKLDLLEQTDDFLDKLHCYFYFMRYLARSINDYMLVHDVKSDMQARIILGFFYRWMPEAWKT